MSDPVQQVYEDVRAQAKEYFGLGDSQAETFMKLAKLCAATSGAPLAGAGAVALSAAGAVSIPLIGSIPGYLAGAIAGFVGGTTACMVARGAATGHVREILGQSNISEKRFKSEVKRLLSLADGTAGHTR